METLCLKLGLSRYFNTDGYSIDVPDATLKRFTRMGENVILLSENPSYDPIMLSEGQVSILGIAVGVVKNG